MIITIEINEIVLGLIVAVVGILIGAYIIGKYELMITKEENKKD